MGHRRPPLLTRRRHAPLIALVVAIAVGAACTDDGDRGLDRRPGGVDPSTTSVVPGLVERPSGGSVRVGVPWAPLAAAPTLGGAGVRALVHPQLFVADAEGGWLPSLVEPGSDRTVDGGRSAVFRLRDGAVWSDGSPIGVSDLDRTKDGRFVEAVVAGEEPRSVVVRFVQQLPGWRRLWSGVDSVAPPGPGVWGGPFVVASEVPGLETVLRRNETWYGRREPGLGGPWLDEVRLVLVPDPETARVLLDRGELDVVAPSAFTARHRHYAALDGVSVEVGDAQRSGGGWWAALLLNPAGLDADGRRAVVGTVERLSFVDVLLDDEAVRVDGLASEAWVRVNAGTASGMGTAVDLVAAYEEPMLGLLQRSMQQRARSAGGSYELRNAEADVVEPWIARGEYDVAFAPLYDGPEVCWLCRWAAFDEAAARAADGGVPGAAAALEERLRDEHLLVPLWRSRPMVAWRTGVVDGLRPSVFGVLPAAWNAWEWWAPREG